MMNSPNLTTVPLPPTNGRSIGDDSRRPASRGMLREPGHRIKTGENSRPTNGEYSTPAHTEFGIVAPVGRKGVNELLHLKEQIVEFDRMIMVWHRSNETSKRLRYIPGVGPMLATALVASVADPRTFRSGRNFSAWIGLVPTQHSSGGKDRLGSISKQGDRYLRSLFVAGALAVIRYAKIHGTKHR